MPVTFSVQIVELRPATMLLRAFNGLVRQALAATARYWLKNIAPRHFDPSATQRYGYKGRSARWRQIKAEAISIRRKDGSIVPAPKPPSPLVYSGDMKKDVLGKPAEAFNIRAVATSAKQTVRIKIPLPHPINPKNAGELTRINDPDREEMQIFAIRELKRLIAELQGAEQTTIS